jgi:hypothetical protein
MRSYISLPLIVPHIFFATLYSFDEEILLKVKEQRNILDEISNRNANWTGYILRRNCLLQRIIAEKMKGGGGLKLPGIRGRRRRKLLDDLKERRGSLLYFSTSYFATHFFATLYSFDEEVLLRVKEQRNILHEISKGRLTGLVTFCVETAFYNGLLQER